jgi:heptosyltransferase II
VSGLEAQRHVALSPPGDFPRAGKVEAVTPTVVIQSKQGIGDVIWHLPYVRAIAAASPGGKVVFLALPSTYAQELLQAEPCIARTVYFESRGPELKRLLHQVRLVGVLRRLHCTTAWCLDVTVRPAIAAFLAGIPNRIGVGIGPQRWFITNRGVDQASHRDDPFPFKWLDALMAQMNVTVGGSEPSLNLPSQPIEAVRRKFGSHARPWVVLGLGGSHPLKQWPSATWVEFLAGLRRRFAGTVFLIGGAAQAPQAADLMARTAGAPVVDATALSILEAAALLRDADLFVGPDSGPMNLAAAVGTPAFAMFGATRVLTYSKFIHPILPDDGGALTLHGMTRISADNVLSRIAPYLATHESSRG